MGAYIPPADTTGVDDLRSAWDKCPANCHPLLLGDLNINFGSPRSEREEIIVDLLDEMGLADMSRKFLQRWRNGRQGGGRWTWRQRRGRQWHQSQPDYCMARERDGKLFQNVAVRRPRIHDSDHRAQGRRRFDSKGAARTAESILPTPNAFPPATPACGGAR
jgi:hypothetical protein